MSRSKPHVALGSPRLTRAPGLRGARLRRGLVFVFTAALSLIFLLPTILTFTNSFMSQTELAAHYGTIFSSLTDPQTYVSETVRFKYIPDMVTFKQFYTVLLQSPEYLLKFWNSVILVVPIVLGQVAIAALASYSLMRYNGRVRSLIFFTYVILMLMPYQVMLVPNYLVADWLKILNTRWAILFPGFFAPFSVFLLTKFMRRIPAALIEAALIDGASEWQVFTKVCLPQCRSALYSIVILVFIDYWNMVEQPLILLNDVEKQPLSVYLSTINSGEVGVAFAVAVIYMIPPLLLFLHGEEYLIEGITHSGSVKG